MTSDDALMSRVQADDTAAFGRLYDRYAGAAFAVAQSVCRNKSLAEDVVQEGFLAIWRARASYRPKEGSSFRGWAMKVIHNRALDSHRKAQAGKRPPPGSGEQIEPPDPSPLPDHLALESERGRTLRRALRQLPEAQREVIALGFFGGLTHFEIADLLGVPRGTVKGRMRHGLEKLSRETEVADLREPHNAGPATVGTSRGRVSCR